MHYVRLLHIYIDCRLNNNVLTYYCRTVSDVYRLHQTCFVQPNIYIQIANNSMSWKKKKKNVYPQGICSELRCITNVAIFVLIILLRNLHIKTI